MKKAISILLALVMIFSLAGCGNADMTASPSATPANSEYLFAMTKNDLMEYCNDCIAIYNADHEFEPVSLLEPVPYGYKNGSLAFTFHVSENKDGAIRKIRVDYFGNNRAMTSGMIPLTAYWVYLSILINLFAEEDATEVGTDADAFFAGEAESGEIKASNGILFEWSNISSSRYWYTATITLSEDSEPTSSLELNSTQTQTPGFNVSALDTIQSIDNYCFSNDYYIDGEDPRLADCCKKESYGYLCDPTLSLTLSFTCDENDMLTGVLFSYVALNGNAIDFVYFQDYIYYLLLTLYSANKAENIYNALGVGGMSITISHENVVQTDLVDWYLNNNGAGYIYFQGFVKA